jgi:hypothetical protein
MKQVLLFSFTAMANPTLVAATTVMLLLSNPKKLMLGYLLGALLTSVTLGLVIVFALKGSTAVSTAKHTVNPALDLAAGAILLVIAFVLATGRHERLKERRMERKTGKQDKGPPRWRRALDKGSPRTTFVVGAALTLPGASYLAALAGVTKLNPSTVSTVLLVVLVNLIMLALIEVPLISYAVAPEWTPVEIQRVKEGFSRHAHTIAVVGTLAVGTLLIVRGVITLAS